MRTATVSLEMCISESGVLVWVIKFSVKIRLNYKVGGSTSLSKGLHLGKREGNRYGRKVVNLREKLTLVGELGGGKGG